MDERELLTQAREYANQYVDGWDKELNMLCLKLRTVAEDSYAVGYRKAVEEMNE